MGKRIKSYLVFTSFFYRIVMFLLMPAVLAGLFLWFYYAKGNIGIIGGVGMAVIMLSILSLIEIISDNWLFGGTQTRNTMKMDYLRTSGRGMGILRKALAMDMFRKLFSGIGISVVYYLGILWGDGYLAGYRPALEASMPEGIVPSGGMLWWIGVLLFPVTVSWFLSVLGTFLARFGDMLWISMLVGYGLCILGMLSLRLPGLWSYMWGYNVCFLILGLLCSIVAVKVAIKKVEGSYYD